MSIDPKRPEGVIQIEYHHLGERQSIAEGIWGNALLNHNAGIGRFKLLGRLFDHAGSQEQKSRGDRSQQCDIQMLGPIRVNVG